jgi:dTDP-glucose 4,6-dehydratase
MKLLVTGGAGFIGSAVICHIIQNTQDEVVNLDFNSDTRNRYRNASNSVVA